ncbi:Uma2 family endonuclease [Streptomyces sp. G45]|uniref:Uma2 family endonuclease n=1 Tax=Streptomyces sp. G45 TaxID=3406627 RepID=UPI003C26A825
MSAASDQEHELQDEPEQYHWPIPPVEGWTVDDLDRIPGLPPHTELIDGSLVFMSPQRRFHTRTMYLLESALLRQTPDHLDVDREMTVKLDVWNRPEPDIVVYHAEADTGDDQTWFKPEDIVLAIEVVSPDSVIRDRDVKPRKYAEAGVPHFWRVEQDGATGLPVVHTFVLDPGTKAYGPTGVHFDRLKTSRPFDIDIDLTALNRRRP